MMKLTILPLMLALLLTCSKDSTSPTTITISGTVTLEGRTDHSGVTVSLYRTVQLDTALVRINQQYPNIGVQISQETEFDHREHSAVYSTTTNASGNWSIDNVTPGTYNVVAEKDSFGWRYALAKETSQSIEPISLSRSVSLSGGISSDLVLDNRFIRVENLDIPTNITLQIKGDSWVLINDNSSIRVSGKLHLSGAPQNWVKLLPANDTLWNMIEVKIGGEIFAENALISGSRNGIYNRSEKLHLKHIIFRDNVLGLENFDVADTLLVHDCVFANNERGLNNFIVSNTSVSRCVFYQNGVAARIASGQSGFENTQGKLNNNIFYKNDYSVYINFPFATQYANSTGDFISNDFRGSIEAIKMGSNGFYHARENNFRDMSQRIIYAQGNVNRPDTLNFQQNYWGLFSVIEIKNRITDREDSPTNLGSYVDVRNFLYGPAQIQ